MFYLWFLDEGFLSVIFGHSYGFWILLSASSWLYPMFRCTQVCGAALLNDAPPFEAVTYWHIGPFVSLAAPSVQADLSHCVYMQQIKKCPQSTGATMRACAAGDDEQSPSAPSSLCGSFGCKDDEIKNCVVCSLWYKDTYATRRYEATLLCDRSLLFSSAVESCRKWLLGSGYSPFYCSKAGKSMLNWHLRPDCGL